MLEMCLSPIHELPSTSRVYASRLGESVRRLVKTEAAEAGKRLVVTTSRSLRAHNCAHAVLGAWRKGRVAGDLVDVDGCFACSVDSCCDREAQGAECRWTHFDTGQPGWLSTLQLIQQGK